MGPHNFSKVSKGFRRGGPSARPKMVTGETNEKTRAIRGSVFGLAHQPGTDCPEFRRMASTQFTSLVLLYPGKRPFFEKSAAHALSETAHSRTGSPARSLRPNERLLRMSIRLGNGNRRFSNFSAKLKRHISRKGERMLPIRG